LSAAYIGASSDYKSEFAEIFELAFTAPTITSRRVVTARYSAMDNMCLTNADIIVLGGGDPIRGWEVMKDRSMTQIITERYLTGTALVGVSAGAVQLGVGAWQDDALVSMFRFVPFIIDVHDEDNDFAELARMVGEERDLTPPVSGLGIPRGAGLRYHPEQGLTPLRKPLVEIRLDGGQERRSLLIPEKDESEPRQLR
jgi:hypothetical protein